MQDNLQGLYGRTFDIIKFRIVILVISALVSSTAAWADTPVDETDVENIPEVPKEEVPYREIRTFTDVFARIKQDYVETVDDKTLLESAVRGMLAGLDPHSTYLDREEYNDLQIGTTGEFGGLGIEVRDVAPGHLRHFGVPCHVISL